MNDEIPAGEVRTKIDGELPTCSQKARRKPQMAAVGCLTGGSRPPRLLRAADPTHDWRSGAGNGESRCKGGLNYAPHIKGSRPL